MNRSLHLFGLRFSLFFFSAILIVGCDRKPQEVNVQVFIVTKGSENVKLGLIEVKAIPLEKAKEALRPVLTKRDSDLAALKAKIETAEDNQKRARKWKEQQLSDAQAQATKSSQVADKSLESFRDAIKAAVAAAKQRIRDTKKFISMIDDVFRQGDSPDCMMDDWVSYNSNSIAERADNAIKLMMQSELQALPIKHAEIARGAQSVKSANELARKSDKDESYSTASRNASNIATTAMKAFNNSIIAAVATVQSYKRTAKENLDQGLEKDIDDLDHTTWGSDTGATGISNAEKAIRIVGNDQWNDLLDRRAAVLKAATEFKASAQQKMADASEVGHYNDLLQKDTVREFYAEYAPIRSADNLIAALPPPIFSAKTDADGKCRLLLPHDQRWVLSATGSRHLAGDKKEEYTWIVEVPENKASSVSLLLSNENLLDNGSNPLGM